MNKIVQVKKFVNLISNENIMATDILNRIDKLSSDDGFNILLQTLHMGMPE